ncbi:hypothetical protein DMUE_3836 [Dictyocoela muelleri]|nr:hypothetical protein DMUE_3836 [Dictyocoela muelleri]
MIVDSPFRMPRDIYDTAKMAMVSEYQTTVTISHLIPSFDSLKSSIFRLRGKLVPVGNNIIENCFDLDFFIMENGKNMLLHVEFGSSPIVVLGESEYIESFTEMRTLKIIMDRTFKSSSSSFLQVYIIHGLKSEQSSPLLYCFLSDKTERTYKRVFEAIRDSLLARGIQFRPSKIKIDFGQTAFNDTKSGFPEAEVKGCYFHFRQAI